MEKFFFSNHLDVLLENLKLNLFSNFAFSSRKIVFVPNIYVKNYLMQKIAEDERFRAISFIHFIDIKNFSKSFSELFLEEDSLKTPTSLELNLLIEENILKFLRTLDKDFSKVSSYLNFKRENFSYSKKKLRSLVDRLTHYFFLYGIYGKKEENNWQSILFEEIFKKLNNPLKQFSNPKFLPFSKKIELHFFAIFFMPKIFRKVLKKVKNFSIHHYLLSPCIYFWEDVCSSNKRKFIKKNFKTSDEFNNYLKNTNLLLANMGKIQRNYLKILIDEEMETFEHYVEGKKDWLEGNSFKEVSLLDALKYDMLYLRNPEKSGHIDIKKSCKTLQIHETSSKLREVEVLYDFILSVLKKEKNFLLSEISIFIPNVDEYVPYIHMVFSESSLDYKISETEKNSFFTKGIIHLFSLVKSRFEKNFVLELFENEAFSLKHKITKEEILKLKMWIEKANIDWGLDEEHKKTFLKNSTADLHLKSWESGIDRILSSFIFAFKDLNYENPPVKGINFSDLDLFEKFIKIFEILKKDIKSLEKKFLLKKWGALLLEIVERNFLLKENRKEISDFKDFIRKLLRADALFKDSPFDFDIIFKSLKKELLNKKSSFNEFSVEAIHFSSFKNSFIPKKVICLLGMGEDFPKKDNFCSLNLLNKKNYPSKKDVEKNYFLQAILSCQNFIYMSYVREKEKDLSSLVKELLHYVNSAYKIKNEELITTHPMHSFDKKYFLKEHEDFYTFSEKNYLAAKKYYSNKKSKKEKSLFQLTNTEKNLPDVLDVKDLKLLSNNPLKFYFNRVCNVFLEEKRKDELFLSFLEKYILFEKILKEKDFLKNFERQGGLPSGLLKEIERENIKVKIERYFESLKAFEVEKKDIFEIELKLSCRNFRKVSNKIEIPAITVSLGDRKVKIIGKIKNVSEKGFLINSDVKPFDILKKWPEILIFLHLKDVEKTLLFTKVNKKLKVENIEKKESLKNYLKYYERCLSIVSPLLRDFTKILFVKDEKELKGVLEKALSSKKVFEDVYFEKFFLNQKTLPHKEIFENWIPFLRKTFKPIIGIYEKL